MTGTLSTELQAMVQMETALKDLQEDERNRVMQWALSRFGIQAKVSAGSGSERSVVDASPAAPQANGAQGNGAPEYEDLATFYDAAGPNGDMEKALVGAYWIQVREGAADVDAQSVNTQLKHLGHGIGNVTRAFDGLKAQKPALVVQLRKEGSTQQARKRFKVTAEGRKAVERMLARTE